MQVTAESPKMATFRFNMNVMTASEILGYPKIVCFGSVGSFCHNWVWATLAHQPWEDRRFGRLITGQWHQGLPSWSHDGCTPKIQIIASGKPISWLSLIFSIQGIFLCLYIWGNWIFIYSVFICLLETCDRKLLGPKLKWLSGPKRMQLTSSLIPWRKAVEMSRFNKGHNDLLRELLYSF